jgi:hypothetical protein
MDKPPNEMPGLHDITAWHERIAEARARRRLS